MSEREVKTRFGIHPALAQLLFQMFGKMEPIGVLHSGLLNGDLRITIPRAELERYAAVLGNEFGASWGVDRIREVLETILQCPTGPVPDWSEFNREDRPFGCTCGVYVQYKHCTHVERFMEYMHNRATGELGTQEITDVHITLTPEELAAEQHRFVSEENCQS